MNEQPRFRVGVQQAAGGAPQSFEWEREALDPIGAEIVEVAAESDEDFADQVRDFDALIARNRRITPDVITRLRRVRVIGLGSVGADTVDVDAATAAGIVVTNVPDVFIEEVADHTLALFLAAHRRLHEMRAVMLDGRWGEGRRMLSESPRLWGQTFGLVSFGNVARAVARRLQPFGLHVLAYDPYVSELDITAEHVEPVSFTELLERSDFVSNHAPLNEQTRHMFSAARFRAMKSTALFVNTGRGPTVDEGALIEALRSGAIAGAALDVFEVEPADPENPLLHMDNVIVSPHVASATSRMMPEARRRLGREIAEVLLGRWPRSAVNPQVLERTDLERWQPHAMSRGPNR